MSTSLSADGRYLIVVPKLSAMRVLDLRTGTVLTRFTSNSTSSTHGSSISRSVLLTSSSSSSSSSSGSMGQQRSRSDSYQRMQRKDNTTGVNRTQRLSTASSRTSLSSQGQYVSFCAGDAMVATGGGGGVDEGCAVKLWSADSGHLIKSLSLRCGYQNTSSPSLSFSSSFSQSLSLSNSGAHLLQRSSAVRDSSPGIAFSRENDRDRDREGALDTMSTSAEEKRTDMRERPRRGSDEVEREVRESNWLNDGEIMRDRESDREGERDRDRGRDRGSDSGGDRDYSDSERDRERDREGGQYRGRDRDGERDRDKEREKEREREVCRDPQLEIIASSPVFSTRYDERYGIIAAASAAGISLWI
jgi:hypothetical protein